MGPLLAQLTKMGLENIGYELITDVVSFKTRNTDNRAVIMEWIGDRHEFQLAELRKMFRDQGRAASSVDYTMKMLVQDGTLVPLGDGHYRRSDPQLPAPAQQRPERASVDRRAPQYTTSNRALMWSVIGKRKTFEVSLLRERFREEGRPLSSLYSQLSKLTKEGHLKQLDGEGKYEVVTKSKTPPHEITAPKKKPAKHLNGHAHGVTHGV